MLQLAKRHTRARSATLAFFFLGVVRLAYQVWQKRRGANGGSGSSPSARLSLGAGGSRQKHRALEAPEENRSFHRQVAAALVWYQEGSCNNGKAGLLGESGGIKSYMIAQDPMLRFFVSLFGFLGAIGEALLTTAVALVIVYMIAMECFRRFWPFAAAAVTLLFGRVLVWFSSMLQGSAARSGSRSGVLLGAVEALVMICRNGKVPVLLHSVTYLPGGHEDAVKQAMFRRVATTAQHGDSVCEGFAVRGNLSVLLEVDPCEASASDSSSLGGLIGAYVLEDQSAFGKARGCLLHHFSLLPAPLRGPAAIAAVAGPLYAFLAEVKAEAKRGLQMDKESTSIDSKVAKLADEAILLAVGLSDSVAASSSSSSPWSFEEHYRGLDIETREVPGARFPMVRARMVVQPSEIGKLYYPSLTSPTLRQACFAREVFAFSCSGAAQQLSNTAKGNQTILQNWTFGSGEQEIAGTSASFMHLTLKPSALQPAADGVFLQAIRRAPSGVQGGGDRFTYSMVPAPENMAGSYSQQVDALRAGQPTKQMNQPVWIMDVKPSAAFPGGLDICCISHIIPEVSYFIPTGMVRQALMHSACCASAFVEMAKTMRVPNPLKVQHFDVEEELAVTQVAGRHISISKSLVGILCDTGSKSSSSCSASASTSAGPGLPTTGPMPSKAAKGFNGLAARKVACRESGFAVSNGTECSYNRNGKSGSQAKNMCQEEQPLPLPERTEQSHDEHELY